MDLADVEQPEELTGLHRYDGDDQCLPRKLAVELSEDIRLKSDDNVRFDVQFQ